MSILLLIALPSEVGRQELSTSNVDVVFTGIGKLNAYQETRKALRNRFYEYVINAGTAGSAKHPIGTVLHPTVIKQGDFFITKEDPDIITCSGKSNNQTILTQDNFVSFDKDIDGKVIIPEELKDIDCFDMEAYAIARAAQFMAKDVHFLKIVSDNLDGTVKDWEANLKVLAPKLIKAIVSYIRINLGQDYEPKAIY